MADNKKMSVEDILAACRAGDGGDSSSSEPVSPAAPEAPKADPPKKKPAPPSGDMSVADVLAAARGGGGSSVEKPAAAAQSGSLNTADILAAARGAAAKPKSATAKPKVAKPGTGSAKASPKQADAKPSRTGPMDTSSILAAARSGDKPGPMSKAEAAAKSKGPAGGKAQPVLPPLPEKPAYAIATPKPAAADDNRRGFISALFGSALAIGFVSLSGTFLAWTLGTARFMFPNILIEPPSRFKVGFPSDFAAGTVATQFKAQFGVWVTNVEYEGQQQIVALKTVCTHLGCTPNWLEAEQKFKCPCHGSGFYKDGINFEGPAPRPLERYAISVADDGQIEIDKSKTFQEQIGQWKNTASFVPV